MEGEDLDQIIKRFEDALGSILDKHALEKAKRITLRKEKKLWYSENLKEQRFKVWRLEKKMEMIWT